MPRLSPHGPFHLIKERPIQGCNYYVIVSDNGYTYHHDGKWRVRRLNKVVTHMFKKKTVALKKLSDIRRRSM